jgi:hypothetical protein
MRTQLHYVPQSHTTATHCYEFVSCRQLYPLLTSAATAYDTPQHACSHTTHSRLTVLLFFSVLQAAVPTAHNLQQQHMTHPSVHAVTQHILASQCYCFFVSCRQLYPLLTSYSNYVGVWHQLGQAASPAGALFSFRWAASGIEVVRLQPRRQYTTDIAHERLCMLGPCYPRFQGDLVVGGTKCVLRDYGSSREQYCSSGGGGSPAGEQQQQLRGCSFNQHCVELGVAHTLLVVTGPTCY